MPTSVGPNTKGEENLVFGYDLGDVSNSYKGEPTENLITDTAAFDSDFWNQKSGTVTANDVIGPRGIQNAAKIVATNTDPYIYSSAIVTVSTGNATWSIWAKGIGNTVGKSAQVRINFSGTATGTADTNASINLTERWQLLQTTANVTSGGTIKFGLEAPNGAVSGDIMYFADPMFEQKSHATPFTAGTRSASQGLIDLTSNSTIDLTNVSFDSNAQVDYDGSNDYVSLGNPAILRDLTAGTIEAVYKRDASTGTYQMIFTDAGSDLEITYSGNVLQFYIGNSGLSYTHAVTGQYFYIAGTWGPGFKKMYINGVEVASGTNTGIDTGNRDRYIGGRGTSFPFNGKIPMVKVYSRTLTASEIKANYKAIKGRFNI